MKGITYPKGFKAAGVSCGIKSNGNKDLALLLCEQRATAAGVFTKNIVKGHSLERSMMHLADGHAQAVVINSGNANACLASRGRSDALKMAELTAEICGVDTADVLPASTGVIGVPMDMDKFEFGVRAAYEALSDSGEDAAQAIMTTDTHAKTAEVSIDIDGTEIRIGGMAKGSGMIHPNMATMIAVITTDAVFAPKALKKTLKSAVNRSFNRISVDGDTSVCDKVLLLSSNIQGTEITKNTKSYDLFFEGLTQVCETLAKMLAADGEGATKLLTIDVKNARTKKDAKRIASTIAKSPLCKTAAFGNDANWGRLLTAAGYSGAKFNPELVDIFIGDVMVCKDGGGLAFDEDAAFKTLDQKEVTYTIDLKDGEKTCVMWTCDLTYEYVKINGEYRT